MNNPKEIIKKRGKGAKSREDKQKTSSEVVVLNPAISLIIVNINGLNTIEMQNLSN